ncbi:MAG TPA: HD domain-containing protein [bacterium]|nr:HD domain-containing protein [bacterium]HQG44414.1 HD domain-containing protein [bacterium]HQI47714.1 HD domain-containing protein [bacterium]HQJ64075.1 HD domain-containing protein [bacterium]
MDQAIEFIKEADQLKNIFRKTRNFSNERFENDAEHSWHIGLMAITLQPYANEAVNIATVLKMLILHDLGEIFCGDTIVYAKNEDHKRREMEAAQAFLGLLGPVRQEEYSALLREFEARSTPEARYANAIDRAEPILQNIHHGGETWRKNGISFDRVVALNAALVADGSKALWAYLLSHLEQMKAAHRFSPE